MRGVGLVPPPPGPQAAALLLLLLHAYGVGGSIHGCGVVVRCCCFVVDVRPSIGVKPFDFIVFRVAC